MIDIATIVAQKQAASKKMILLGIQIAELAAQNKITRAEISSLYDKLAAGLGLISTSPQSREVQVCKLRVFYRFGKAYPKQTTTWLLSRTISRQSGWSDYETLLKEMRALL